MSRELTGIQTLPFELGSNGTSSTRRDWKSWSDNYRKIRETRHSVGLNSSCTRSRSNFSEDSRTFVEPRATTRCQRVRNRCSSLMESTKEFGDHQWSDTSELWNSCKSDLAQTDPGSWIIEETISCIGSMVIRHLAISEFRKQLRNSNTMPAGQGGEDTWTLCTSGRHLLQISKGAVTPPRCHEKWSRTHSHLFKKSTSI